MFLVYEKGKNIELILFLRVISAVCTEMLFYRTNSKVLLYALRDNHNNFLVQLEFNYYVFRITKPKTLKKIDEYQQ